ncbi:MAG: glycosyltransferase family 9 protein [Myxococcota bacterium]|nr:glycosyltransferase family 9 protein [Myxococcota bacterium]
MPTLVLRAPNHLGDGVMALPAVTALSKAHDRVHLLGPPWAATLYRGLGLEFHAPKARPAGDRGLTLAPSFSSAWGLRHLPERVGVQGQGRRLILTRSTPQVPGEHRSKEYARVTSLLGVECTEAPRFQPSPDDVLRACMPPGHLAIAPLSPSGSSVMWPGFAELAQQSDRPVVVYLGPDERWEPLPHLPRVQHRDLGLVAAELQRAHALVVNDSGLSHLARAAGVPTVVVHGSTDPLQTGAQGSLPVKPSGPPSCWPCYAKGCPKPQVHCLMQPVSQVQAALRELQR